MTQTTVVEPVVAPVEVRTMPETFEVYVDEEDILLGRKRDGRQCAIARATRRHFGLLGRELDLVIAGGLTHLSSIGGRLYSHNAFWFVYDFDSGEHVKPRLVRFTATGPPPRAA